VIVRRATIRPALVLRADKLICAIPLEHVIETMRPQRIDPVGAMPEFVMGVAIVRGIAVPVISLEILFDARAATRASRFVACMSGERRFVLAASEVLGVRDISGDIAGELPALLQYARAEVVQAVGVLDQHLLMVLNAGRILPDEVWQSLHQAANGRES
jgi:purine-binding chemotaxis protein CheW